MKTQSDKTALRPSSLPKLAACRLFEGKPGASEAAMRGTRVDRVIREAWRDGFVSEPLADDEAEAVRWALAQLKELAKGEEVTTDEAELKAISPFEDVKAGTMDAACYELNWLADFKTGQVRDYEAQMAAYALACMEKKQVFIWTAHLLFVDQQKRISRTFDWREAAQIVRDVIDAPMEPTSCDYCAWCARDGECPLTRRQAALALASGSELEPPALKRALEDDAYAHMFLTAVATANRWAEKGKEAWKEKLQGAESEYFKLSQVAGRKSVIPAKVEGVPVEKLLEVCGNIPLATFKKAFKGVDVPAEWISEGAGYATLRLNKIKKELPR